MGLLGGIVKTAAVAGTSQAVRGRVSGGRQRSTQTATLRSQRRVAPAIPVERSRPEWLRRLPRRVVATRSSRS